MRARQLAGAGLAAGALTCILAMHGYAAFRAIRLKVVRSPEAAVAGHVEVALVVDPRVADLRPPFAVIWRVGGSAKTPQDFILLVDGHPVCTQRTSASRSTRLDCDVAAPDAWTATVGTHVLEVDGPGDWSLEYLEVASYHGRSTGPLEVYVLPRGADYIPVPAAGLGLAWIVTAALLLVPPAPRRRRVFSRAHVLTSSALAVLAFVVMTVPAITRYNLVFSPWSFAGAVGIVLFWRLAAVAALGRRLLGSPGPRAARGVACTTVVLSAPFALAFWLFGNVQLTVGRHTIGSSGATLPLEVVVAAVTLYFFAGGWSEVAGLWRAARAAWPHVNLVVTSRAAMVLAIAIFVATLAGAATTAGGADSSGYLSQAERWLHGTLAPRLTWAEQVPWPNAAWTFTPLGYTPSLQGPPFRMAPIYPPGLPWLLAAAKAIGGQSAMDLVMPVCCTVLLLATYGIGRRLQGPATGLAAAWLVATSPIVLFMSMTVMSDVPAGAGWACAFYFLIGDGAWSALAAGLAASVAIVIRPNTCFLAAIMGSWFVIRPGVPGSSSWARRLGDLACFAGGSAPGVGAIALVFDRWYGSPLQSGYGSLSHLMAIGHVWPNVVNYARWAVETNCVLVLAAAAGFALPLAWRPGMARRAMALAGCLVAATAVEYTAYLVWPDWTFLRFFLVVWPLAAVVAAGAIAVISRGRSFGVGVAVSAAVVVAGVWGIRTARDLGAFAQITDRHYAAVAKIVQDVVPPGGVVYSFQHSGSLRYYSGRVPIRYDQLPPDWLDRSVDWLAGSGVHSYAVLESWEVPLFRERFRNERLGRLEAPVVVYHSYQDRWTVFIYDLSAPTAIGAPTVVLDTDPSRWRDWPAGPEPVLVLKKAP